jgi:uncharacterized protein (TIGR02452 family)
MNDNRTKIIELLRSTSRGGIENVITWLDTEPIFFTASAARIHHDNVEGGLAQHSLNVFRHAKEDWETRDDAFKKKYPFESVIISALLHDVCKKDVYYIDADGIPQWNEENHRKGHGLRSVHLLEELGLSLTPDERMAIWWHMGAGNEMSQPDYPQEYAIAMQDPFCQLIHEADHKAAKVSDKETKETRLTSLKWDANRTLFRWKNEPGRYHFGAIRGEVYKHNLEIFRAWKYESSSGKVIDLIGSRQQLLDATKVYREPVSAAEISARYTTTQTGCANEDCLVVTKQLIDLGLNPAVLNLADAYHACGMYNSGSGAQEESLCRASTLSLTLYQYYNKTWAKKADVPLRPVSAYPMNIHFGGIYSPGVTVFRDNQDTGFALREEPYQTAIISLAALNFKAGHKTNNLEYRADDGSFTSEGEQIMFDKIRTIYRIALLNGHNSLVLGAFGCGVFQLKPELVAKYFKQVLDEEEFRGKFHTIAFAMLEGKATPRKKVEEEGDFAPFYQIFGRF